MPHDLPWVWAPEYEMRIGPHVFPTVKYRLVKERLLDEGTLRAADLHRPRPASREELARVHDDGYLERVMAGRLSPSEERRLELPFSVGLREAFVLCCGGSIVGARLALQHGVAVHLGGGFHHAFAGHGEGFCLLNDVAVAVRAARAEGPVDRVSVIDLDVHHGNGTAAIFREEPEVFTFSMHQDRNYPFQKPPSDLDIGLDDGVDDEAYLKRLEGALRTVLGEHRPGLAVLLAGADPYRGDQLGGLGLTMEGLRERDRLVLEGCRREGVPVLVVLAGGYAFRLDDTIEIHANTVRTARGAGAASGLGR